MRERKFTRSGLRPYVRQLADAMGLRDWTIRVLAGEPESATAAAAVRCIYGRRVADIVFSSKTLGQPPGEVRYLAVHELVHCQFAAMHNYLDEIFEKDRSAELGYTILYEHGVDAAAEALAPRFPLPAYPPKKKGKKRAPAPQ